MKVEKLNLTYEGLVPRIQKAFLSKDVEAMQPHIRAFVERGVTFSTCLECRVGARSERAVRRTLLAALRHTLDSFVEIGLGYLSLDRPSGTLSGLA